VAAYEAGDRRTIEALRASHTQAPQELRERLAQARRVRTEVDTRIALLPSSGQLFGRD